MDLRPKDPEAATEGKGLYMQNRRVLEFFLLAGFLGIGAPVAVLMGVGAGDKTAAIAYPKSEISAVPSVDYKSIVMGSPGDEEKGQALFQVNCVACHGAAADGKGPAAPALKPPPRNFQDPAERWTKSRKLPEIYNTISEGSPGTAMIGFSVSLSVQDRWALVHYIASLPGVKGQFPPIDEALAAAWRPAKAP